jgi:hypothetical protein
MSIQEYLTKGSDKSSMRLGFITCVYTACYGGFCLICLDVILNDGKNIVSITGFVSALLLTAFSGKTISGRLEQKKEVEKNV